MNFIQKTSFIFLVLLVSGILSSLAQKNPMRYGRVERDLVTMKSYEADSSAQALILGDFGTSSIRYDEREGFVLHYTRHLRVKIFHSMAFNLGDFKVPLYNSGGDRERITRIKGKVYNFENGRITETDFARKEGFEDVISDNYKTFNFSMPNLKEGSVFEIEYSITTPFLYTLPSWIFQSQYPTVFSEYVTDIPEYFIYKPLMQGFVSLTSHNKTYQRRNIFDLTYTENTTIYRIENIPGFRSEPYMNARINYVSKIEHELTMVNFPFAMTRDFSSTWPKLNKQLMDSESFGKQLQRSNFLSSEVSKLQSENTDPLKKMICAYELVKKEMTWNDRNTIYASRNLRRAWNDKTGSVADINMLLVVLLRELDIVANPVILSTRNNGIINPAQIMLTNFNYVIASAEIDGKTYLLDATDKHTPYFLLPERCINGEGRVVSELGGRWVNLEAVKDNNINTVSHIQVKPCGSVHATLTRSKENYLRLRMMEKLRKTNDMEKFMDEFEAENKGIDLLSLEVENQDDWDLPLISKYEFEIKDMDETPKDIIYINPLLIDRVESNPFVLESREFPVDFTIPFQFSQTITIEIPEGYTVDEMPRNINSNLPRSAGNFTYTFNRNENVIEVNMVFRIAKPVFLANEYRALRDFYSNRVARQAQPIVLKKL